MSPVAEPTQNQGPHDSGLMVGERPPPQIGLVGPDGARRGGWKDRGCRLALPTYGDRAEAKSDQGPDWEMGLREAEVVEAGGFLDRRAYGMSAFR